MMMQIFFCRLKLAHRNRRDNLLNRAGQKALDFGSSSTPSEMLSIEFRLIYTLVVVHQWIGVLTVNMSNLPRGPTWVGCDFRDCDLFVCDANNNNNNSQRGSAFSAQVALARGQPVGDFISWYGAERRATESWTPEVIIEGDSKDMVEMCKCFNSLVIWHESHEVQSIKCIELM